MASELLRDDYVFTHQSLFGFTVEEHYIVMLHHVCNKITVENVINRTCMCDWKMLITRRVPPSLCNYRELRLRNIFTAEFKLYVVDFCLGRRIYSEKYNRTNNFYFGKICQKLEMCLCFEAIQIYLLLPLNRKLIFGDTIWYITAQLNCFCKTSKRIYKLQSKSFFFLLEQTLDLQFD